MKEILAVSASADQIEQLDFWVELSCGSYKVGVGEKTGNTIYKTLGMGMTCGTRYAVKDFLKRWPGSAIIVNNLLRANRVQFISKL